MRKKINKLKSKGNKEIVGEVPDVLLGVDPEEVVVPKRKLAKWPFFLGLFFLSVGVVGFMGWQYASTFFEKAGVDNQYLIDTIQKGIETNPFEVSSSQNILFLGIDRIGQNRSNSLLTDTIIIVNVNQSGEITLLPIPRDLWIDSLKTKINALYYYGEKSDEITGEELVKNTLEDLMGVEVHHTLLLDLNSVEKIVDAVGGIEVEVMESFVDDQYPRDDVPPDAMPVSSRYKTISFSKGKQTLNGSRSLEYIRSRKSENENENTDEARSERQEKVINALINKIASKETLQNASSLGNLYALWHQEIQTSLSDEDIISYASKLYPKQIVLKTVTIPIRSADEMGVLFNPPIKKYNQWVYEPVDSTWEEFKTFINESFKQ